MPVDVIIDPSSGQIYWNDNAGSGSTQSIAISGNASDSINFVGYSNFYSAGGGGIGTNILATFNDSATATLVPGTNGYDLGSTSLRWEIYGTNLDLSGTSTLSSSTASTSTTTGALVVTGGVGVAGMVTAANVTLGNLTITGSYTEGYYNIGNSGTAQTLSLANGTLQATTLTSNCTFTMPTATAGKSFMMVINTGAGGFSAVYTSVKWPGGSPPTITLSGSRYDLVSFFADGTNWYGSIIQNYS
jgi:hypothetical protein